MSSTEPLVLPEVAPEGPDRLTAAPRPEGAALRTERRATALPELLAEPRGRAQQRARSHIHRASLARTEPPGTASTPAGSLPPGRASNAAPEPGPQNGAAPAASAATAPRRAPGAAPTAVTCGSGPGWAPAALEAAPAGRGAVRSLCAPRSCALRAVLGAPPFPPSRHRPRAAAA